MWKERMHIDDAESVEEYDFEQDLSGFDGITDSFDADDDLEIEDKNDTDSESSVTIDITSKTQQFKKVITLSANDDRTISSLTRSNLLRKDCKYLSKNNIPPTKLFESRSSFDKERLLKKKSFLSKKTSNLSNSSPSSISPPPPPPPISSSPLHPPSPPPPIPGVTSDTKDPSYLIPLPLFPCPH
mmetsp:Transcript_20226/g.26335  ORF Transcript_20226/g.26335 Transcript_20226/m.26335 type:complete len:185 (-) Transcript_20226:647-1201(-)